jgi:hypothetical protein
VITGSYDLDEGAFIEVTIYFPSPVEQWVEISLLVDSGASRTCVSSSQLRSLGVGVSYPSRRLPHQVVGIGGAASGFTSAAVIAMRHEDYEATIFGLDVIVLADTGSAVLPSVLGRDILFHGDLRLDPSTRRVYFEPPKGSFVI